MLEAGMLREERIVKETNIRIEELEYKNDKLGKIALSWLRSAKQARANIFGPKDKVNYEAGEQEIYKLLEDN